MTETLPFTVPSRHVKALKALADLDDEAYQRIIESVTNSEVELNSIAALQRAVTVGDAFEAPVARRVVLAVIGLYVLHISHSWNLGDVIATASASKELGLRAAEAERFSSRLGRLLESKDVQLLAKAVDIIGEQPNNFHGSRVMTDMRPVFADAGEDSVEAAVVLQTLVLNYFDDSGRNRAFFLSLSEENVRQLQQDLARAERKAKAVRQLCEANNIRLIHGESQGG